MIVEDVERKTTEMKRFSGNGTGPAYIDLPEFKDDRSGTAHERCFGRTICSNFTVNLRRCDAALKTSFRKNDKW